MNRSVFITLLFLGTLCLAPACPPNPVTPDAGNADSGSVGDAGFADAPTPAPPKDASTPDAPQDDCGKACHKMSLIPCPEAKDENLCARTCRSAQGTLTSFNLRCINKDATKSRADVQACNPKMCQNR